MEKTRPILYGVADYAEMRKANAWFVDRTAKIRDLETTRYAVFLRPRRFGKSMLTAILEAYYDVACAARFEALFSGTDIGENPTEERNSYLVLSFDFSAVEKFPETAETSFSNHVCGRINAFVRKYADRIGKESAERILSTGGSTDKMNALFEETKSRDVGIYVIIDEYDNFTNTILAESGRAAYERLCHGGGFYKQFFVVLKSLTTSHDAPLKRIFNTGVSPHTMDDVT
ncbi:MAG: AAA family ATPase, partial [Kiritimatiellae bacterium]|nr:AAA family ATPase [Kiritimatiellia bacterium]